jgi:hypothetical protein
VELDIGPLSISGAQVGWLGEINDSHNGGKARENHDDVVVPRLHAATAASNTGQSMPAVSCLPQRLRAASAYVRHRRHGYSET